MPRLIRHRTLAIGLQTILCMRIAHVAPLYERVPPRLYGGTERVVSHLVEEQVARGHEVTGCRAAPHRVHVTGTSRKGSNVETGESGAPPAHIAMNWRKIQARK